MLLVAGLNSNRVSANPSKPTRPSVRTTDMQGTSTPSFSLQLQPLCNFGRVIAWSLQTLSTDRKPTSSFRPNIAGYGRGQSTDKAVQPTYSLFPWDISFRGTIVHRALYGIIFASTISLQGVGLTLLAQGVDVSAKIVLHTPDKTSEAKHKMSASGTNIVLWLSPLQAGATRPAAAHSTTYRLVQKNKQFSPHLLVVPTGASVEFPNEDPFFHNVFSLFNGKRFDLGLYESGTTRSVRFDREGVSYIFCNIHPEMGAVVLSLSTPYYGISTASGLVVIHNVPPGSYRLNA